MRILAPPGVFRPRSDTWLLAEALRRERVAGARVLDLCTGSGALAVTAALAGGAEVTALDISRRATLAARLNARLNGTTVRARRGDLFQALDGECFDLIVANPPYLPAQGVPASGPQRAWDAGTDGRALLDRVCAEAPAYLRPGGALLLVHSSLCGERATRDALHAAGLRTEVIERRRGPLGPLLSERAEELEANGLLGPGQRDEELLVIRGGRPATLDGPGA